MAEYESKVKKITTTDNGTAYDIPRPLKKDIDIPGGQEVAPGRNINIEETSTSDVINYRPWLKLGEPGQSWEDENGNPIDTITLVPEQTVTVTEDDKVSGKYRVALSGCPCWTDNYYYEKHAMTSIAEVTVNGVTYYELPTGHYEWLSVDSQGRPGSGTQNVYFGNGFLGISQRTYPDTGLDWCFMTRSHAGLGSEANTGTFFYSRAVGTYTVSLVVHQRSTNERMSSGDVEHMQVNDASGACGYMSTAVGVGNLASGRGGVAVGIANTANGERAVAVGFGNTVRNGHTPVFGYRNYVASTASNDLVIGKYCRDEDNYTSRGQHYKNVAIGYGLNIPTRLNDYNYHEPRTIIGNAYAYDEYGYNMWGDLTLAIGAGSENGAAGLLGYQSTAIGRCNSGLNDNSCCLGNTCITRGQQSLAMGVSTETRFRRQFTFGYNVGSYNTNGICCVEAFAPHPYAQTANGQEWMFVVYPTSSHSSTYTVPDGWTITAVNSVAVRGVTKTAGTDYTLNWNTSVTPNTLESITFLKSSDLTWKNPVSVNFNGIGGRNYARYPVVLGTAATLNQSGAAVVDKESLLAVEYNGTVVLHSGGGVVMKDTTDPTCAYKLEITNGQLSISPYTLVTDADIPIHTV